MLPLKHLVLRELRTDIMLAARFQAKRYPLLYHGYVAIGQDDLISQVLCHDVQSLGGTRRGDEL